MLGKRLARLRRKVRDVLCAACHDCLCDCDLSHTFRCCLADSGSTARARARACSVCCSDSRSDEAAGRARFHVAGAHEGASNGKTGLWLVMLAVVRFGSIVSAVL
jgi:hypothetical protein